MKPKPLSLTKPLITPCAMSLSSYPVNTKLRSLTGRRFYRVGWRQPGLAGLLGGLLSSRKHDVECLHIRSRILTILLRSGNVNPMPGVVDYRASRGRKSRRKEVDGDEKGVDDVSIHHPSWTDLRRGWNHRRSHPLDGRREGPVVGRSILPGWRADDRSRRARLGREERVWGVGAERPSCLPRPTML